MRIHAVIAVHLDLVITGPYYDPCLSVRPSLKNKKNVFKTRICVNVVLANF